jgi:hypothetical protein
MTSPFGHVFNGWVYIYSQGIFYCTKPAMEHFNRRQMKIYIYKRFRNLNKLKLIYRKRKTDMTWAGQAFLRLFVDPSRNAFLLGSTP